MEESNRPPGNTSASECQRSPQLRSIFRGNKKYIAYAGVRIHAPPGKVWEAFINPVMIRRWMFGAQVTSDWKEGSPISWKGEWEGTPYDDHGVVRRSEPGRLLQFTHASGRSDSTDVQGWYHLVTIELAGDCENTQVSLSQDNNPTPDARDHAQNLWKAMLGGVRDLLEYDEVRVLFTEYERAFAALELEKNADFFAESFVAAGPRGVIARDRDTFLKLAATAAGFYRQAGFVTARMQSLQESPVSNEFSLVRVRWQVTFRSTEERGAVFDVSYIVQRIGPGPRILLQIAHQDEEEAMWDLSLQAAHEESTAGPSPEALPEESGPQAAGSR